MSLILRCLCTETVRFGTFFALNWCEIVLNEAQLGRAGFNSLVSDTSDKPTLKGSLKGHLADFCFSQNFLGKRY